MKIKEVIIKDFKRFTELKIKDIPESTKLVILVGPNGSGKTSLFESFFHWYRYKIFASSGDKDYYLKKTLQTKEDSNWKSNNVTITSYENTILNNTNTKGKFYFRTAYRNESDFTTNQLNKQTNPTDQLKFRTLMENDISVSENYQRLISLTLSSMYDTSNNSKTVEQLREELVGKIKKSVANVFEDLEFTDIGDPLINGSFYFTKGITSNFHYKNLSAGEKSAFDLILDIIIKSEYYNEAVYCIDEPEAHMHTALQAKLLAEIYNLIPENSQLWISTHSIGMLKEAKTLEEKNPGSVVFLDFGNRDFDSSVTMTPSKMDLTIWNRFMELAFGEFSKLIAPEKIVFCEGTSKGRKIKNFDSVIYTKIFSDKYPTTSFVSVGSCSEIENEDNISFKIIKELLNSSQQIKLVDRDNKSIEEVQECNEKGIKVLVKTHLECYLLDDEIIRKLCSNKEKEDKIEECLEAKKEAIRKSIARGNPSEDIKSASGEIYNELKRILELSKCGDNTCSFLRDTIAPLITEDTEVYKTLEREIFN